jgi:iron complex transport system substrate-binding protein
MSTVVATAVCVAMSTQALSAQAADRVLSIGGSVTEIVYALGEQDRLVARDTTSTYPPAAETLPDVGYMRALAPEGVLSVDPDLILAEAGAGPAETVDLLEAADIPFVTVPDATDAAGVLGKIRAVGDALGVPGKAEELAREVGAELDAARAAVARDGVARKRVLFVLSTEGGRIMASGTGTAAAGIIDLAGGVNAVTEFEGYKPMTDEAVVAAAPEVILMMDRAGNGDGDHASSDSELFSMPAIAPTPAAETRSVVRMDGLRLLGFGPRTADAVAALSEALHDG